MGQQQTLDGERDEERHTSRGPRAGAVDVHLGNRIKLRRTLLSLSQERLGDALGLTFQQVQKYERGVNRVSASRLFDIARVLDVPVGFFYDDLAPELGGVRYGAGYAPASSPSLLPPTRSNGFAEPVRGFSEGQQAFGQAPTLSSADPGETKELASAFSRISDPAQRHHLLALIKSLAR